MAGKLVQYNSMNSYDWRLYHHACDCLLEVPVVTFERGCRFQLLSSTILA